MASLTKSAFNAALLEYYDDAKLTDLQSLHSSFLAMIMRGKFVGRGQPIPVVHGSGAAISGTYSVANTNRKPSKFARFFTEDHGKIFDIAEIDRDTNELATPEAAFKNVRSDIDAKIGAVSRELAHTLLRTQNAVCGVIKTITEGGGDTTIVVEDPADIANLVPDATLVASADADGALRSATAYTVLSVVHSTGTVVLDGTAVTTDLWAIGDSLHREGSAPNGGSAIYPMGVRDWIQGSTVSSDPFLGVDRSVNPELLAGHVVAIGTSSAREAISGLAARLMSRGGRPDYFWVNPIRYAALEAELESSATVEKVVPGGVSKEIAAQIGFNAIRVAAGNGHVLIASDPLMPINEGHMLTMSTWSFQELGGKRQPNLVSENGIVLQKMESADALKAQIEAKGQLICHNPGANGVLTF